MSTFDDLRDALFQLNVGRQPERIELDRLSMAQLKAHPDVLHAVNLKAEGMTFGGLELRETPAAHPTREVVYSDGTREPV